MGIKTATKIIRKTPAEIRIATLDFASEDLATGEAISSVSSTTVTPAGPVVTPGTPSGTKVPLTISGGTSEIAYTILLKVVTFAGQTLEGAVILEVSPA